MRKNKQQRGKPLGMLSLYLSFFPVIVFASFMYARRTDEVLTGTQFRRGPLESAMCLVFLASDSGIKSGSVPRQLATCGSSADYFCTPRRCFPAEK